LFFGTSIAVNILILSKNKKDTKIQFIDASGEEFYKKATNNNILEDKHIDKIIKIFGNKKEIKHISRLVDIEEIQKNDYNLSVSAYIEPKDTKEKIDIKKLNAEIKKTVAKIDILRDEIDKIVAEIEGNEK
jgi:type I restriction enzyme M protein